MSLDRLEQRLDVPLSRDEAEALVRVARAAQSFTEANTHGKTAERWKPHEKTAERWKLLVETLADLNHTPEEEQ